MNRLLTALGVPTWLFWLLLALAACTGLVAFGYRTGATMNEAKWLKAQQEQQKQADTEREKLVELANLVTKDIQAKEAKIYDLRAKLRPQIKDATDGRVCFTPAGWMLWNQSLAGSHGVSDNPRQPAEATAGAGVTDAEVLENHTENTGRWEVCREYLNGIIDWDAKVTGRKH